MTDEISGTFADETPLPPTLDLKSKIGLFSLSGVVTAASFTARVFIELYGVVIGATASALALITSLRNLVQQAFQSSFGRLSDRFGRKTLMLAGLLISAISLALFPWITNGWVLIGGVVFFSIGFASFYPAFTALQGDLTKRENRASLISLLTLVGALGSLIGLIAVGFIGTSAGEAEIGQYYFILYSTAGLFLIGAIVSLLLTDPPVERLKKPTVFSFAPLRDNKRFRQFTIISSLMGFSMSLGWPIFGFVRANYATPQQNTFIWAAFSVLQIISLFITRSIIDKVSRKKLLFFGRVFMFYIPFNLALTILFFPYWWVIGIGGAVSGASNAFFMVGQNSYILDCASEKEKGTYTGIFNFFIGISTFFGSLIMGVVADLIGIVEKIAKGEWFLLALLLFVVAACRFLSSLGYLFTKDPKTS